MKSFCRKHGKHQPHKNDKRGKDSLSRESCIVTRTRVAMVDSLSLLSVKRLRPPKRLFFMRLESGEPNCSSKKLLLVLGVRKDL